MNQKLNINLGLSTEYYWQTDRLSEPAVQTLKQYLCIYYHNRQNRLQALLPLAEFVYNTIAITTYKLSLHGSLYAFDLCAIQLDNDDELSSPVIEQ